MVPTYEIEIIAPFICTSVSGLSGIFSLPASSVDQDTNVDVATATTTAAVAESSTVNLKGGQMSSWYTRSWAEDHYNSDCLHLQPKIALETNVIVFDFFSRSCLVDTPKGKFCVISTNKYPMVDRFFCRNSYNYDRNLLNKVLNDTNIIITSIRRPQVMYFSCVHCSWFHKLDVIGVKHLKREEIFDLLQ